MKAFCKLVTGCGKDKTEDCAVVGDSILAAGEFFAELPESSPLFLAIADGVGGNAAGSIASHLAAEGLTERMLPDKLSPATLTAMLQRLNDRLIEQAERVPAYHRMATTLSGVCRAGESWYMFHLGNTRVWRWSPPYFQQLTEDQTFSRKMQLLGWTEADIAASGRSSEITACLGNGNPSFAAQLVVTDVTQAVRQASKLLLTCDGIHDFVSTSELENAMEAIADDREFVRSLCDYAREKGSRDDITAMLIEL